MKKNKISIIVVMLLFAISILTACVNNTPIKSIDFEPNNGKGVVTVSYNLDSEIVPPNPQKEGFTFDGWFWDDGVWKKPFTVNSILDQPLQANMNLKVYAKWLKDNCTATFITNNGTAVSPISMENGAKINTSPTTTRNEYIFGGWYTDVDCLGSAAVFPYTLVDDIIFYAKWTPEPPEPPKPETFTVTFITNNGTTVSQIITEDKSYVIQQMPVTTRSGYIFDGWYANSSCTGLPVNFPFSINGDTTLYAKWAQYTEGLSFQISVDDRGNPGNEYTVFGSGVAPNTSNLVIPNTYFGLPVKVIGSYAFQNLIALKTISMPTNIIKIENNAFSGCIALSTLVIPSTIQEIELGAFFNCTGIDNITLPFLGASRNAGEDASFIGHIFGVLRDYQYDYMYNQYQALKTVTLTEGAFIGNFAFDRCGRIKTINLPSTIKKIGSSAFDHCTGLTTINLPDGLERIEQWAFSVCESLESLFVPQSVNYIGQYAFQWGNHIRMARTTADGITLVSGWNYGTALITWGETR